MSDVLEMLCESCQTIHPRKPNTSLIQSCPSCGAAMVPTSDNLREIASLRRSLNKACIKLDELKVELNNKHDALFNACCESEALRKELAAVSKERNAYQDQCIGLKVKAALKTQPAQEEQRMLRNILVALTVLAALLGAVVYGYTEGERDAKHFREVSWACRYL